MIEIALQPLTAEAFARYGEVLELAPAGGRAINAGTSRRSDLASRMLSFDADAGRPVFATFHARAQQLAGPWHMLERHAQGSQSFVPLQAGRWVVLVAEGGDDPALSTLAAFSAGPQQGITLRTGTWHHPLIALDAGVFLVLERAGPAVDCEIRQLPHPVRLAGT